MAFYEDPIKAKRVFVVFLSLSILFFIGCGALGYLYYREHKLTKWINTQVSQKDTKIADLEKQITGVTTESTESAASLTEQNTALNKQITSYKAKIAKANTYNEFFKYLNSVINAHAGFVGWTDGEFQTAQTKAQATGDTNFVATINWAWYQTTIDPVVRLVRVWNETASGIENSLK